MSATMADANLHFSARIVTVDYYLTKPLAELDDPCYSGFRSSTIHHVPVIRVFGSTAEGTKCCVHIHGVFPYIYVPNWDHEIREKDFYAFAASLDKAINTSFACSASKTCHVHRISTVSRKPYYGYYEDEKEFLKIEFYNPALIKRASDLLLNGAVFNRNYQPHEAHVPYILQFFIDNNLYGMSYMTFSSWQIRSETAKDVFKQTRMTLEVDSSVKYIIRQCLSGDGVPNNPGLTFIWDEERKRKKLLKGESQITPNVSQVRPDREATRTETYYKHKLTEKLKHFSRSAESTPDTIEEEVTHEELDSQGRDILAILNELAAYNNVKEDKKNSSSSCSSPSIVFSDNEDDELQELNAMSNMELLRSQPLLKQTVESDSILGDDFSDDEIDQEDHLLLSQSIYRHQPAVSSEDEFGGDIDNIPQLDGADGVNTASNRQTKQEFKTSRYNLRSVNVETRKLKDKRSTPKKQYPQLEIATQVSPRGTTRSPAASESPNFRPIPETLPNTFFPDTLCSPTSISPSEGRKSESRRLYPPLDLNFRKSPKSYVKLESGIDAKRRRLRGGIKKRKIDFDELSTADNADMLLTTRWKKLQKSKREQKSSSTIDEKNAIDEARLCDVEDSGNSTYVVEDRNKPAINVVPDAVYAINSEIGSQQYNLKIRFDACGSLDGRMVLRSLLTREPVVMVEKLKASNKCVPDSEYTDPTAAYGSSRDNGSELKQSQGDVVHTHLMVSDDDRLTDKCSKVVDTSCVLSSEFSDDCSDYSSKLKQNTDDDALALSSKSDHVDGGGPLQPSSGETKSSAEVNFWDIGDTRPMNIDEPNSEFSQTITTTLSSKSSVEIDGYDGERVQISGQSGKFDSEHSTPDVIDLEIGREAVSDRAKVVIEKHSPDSSINELSPTIFDDKRLKTTGDSNLKKHNEPSVGERVAESVSALGSFSVKDNAFLERKNDDSDPEIFSQSIEECRALAKCSFVPVKPNCVAGRDSLEHDSSLPTSARKPSDGQRFFFDSSAWDTMERTSNEENGVLSFYDDDSVSVVNATTYCDDEANELKALTPENEPEILSWNAEDCSLGERSPEEDLRNKSSRRLSSEMPSSDDSPPAVKKCVLHSTPRSASKKKSPSPTYTPILRKLMLKKMKAQKMNSRSRLLSLRSEEEPLLADIGEEEELKDSFDEIKKSVPQEATTTVSEKNTSGQKSFSIGSGQIDLTMLNTYGFRMSLENLQNVKTETKHQYLTVMSVEVFATTRGDLCPDPEVDSVHCIFYSIFHDAAETPKLKSGIIIASSGEHSLDLTKFDCEKRFVANENELFDSFVTLVNEWDPDILVGYEVSTHYVTVSSKTPLLGGFYIAYYSRDHIKRSEKIDSKKIYPPILPPATPLFTQMSIRIEMLSWGYIIQRTQYLGRNYVAELSRVTEEKQVSSKEKTLIEDNEYVDDLKLVGRIVLNVWRLMRHEIVLQSYTFENILFHVLHQRVPKHSFRVLTDWWKNLLHRWIVIDYHLLRTEGNILLLQQLDFFGRTSELARLFGIQFYEVLSRGSQFRVESMMLRLAKKQNFVAVSPSVKQRAKMRAPESLPLIMEPESKYYTDPVLVLDFQSLYPSIIIAYNYCFSTCLGRVEYLAEKETFNFGCIQHTVPVELVSKLQLSLNISPCGVAFVKQDVRRGILPEMLDEILNTRLMVKKSMKENKEDKTLQRVLHARQLGLKLIANVTYGYTSANFSGRMPCIEVGDSVVSKGRETLERAIEMVSKNKNWAARVIYGDTDSMFVMLPNRTKEEAFRIGAEIAEAVTNDNPKPVKLKFEKVYYPCILQTKKRYVGYMYESLEQKEPVYDAKGIETVRRDGCPAVAKILEKSLKLLFERNDVNHVKQYVQRQFAKLVAGRLSIQELTFAREYRGMNNYKPAACVPALQLARRAILRDRRSEPRTKERVRYVLTVGAPGVPLIKSVCTPEEFLSTPGAIIDAEYYITRAIIPALERCFSLMDVDVRMWYAELPRKRNICPSIESISNSRARKKTISHYFATSKCVACAEISVCRVCTECQKNPRKIALTIGSTINQLQRKQNYLEKICRSCMSHNNATKCSSLDCPTYYSRCQAMKDVEQVESLEKLQLTFLRCSSSNDR